MNYEKQGKTKDERAKKRERKEIGDPEEKGRENSDDNSLSEEDACDDSALFIYFFLAQLDLKRGGKKKVSLGLSSAAHE